MLRFRRIEVDNFVCFEGLAIEPSLDPDRPLTVIRAENESGKTTLLRAIRWGMYGERGLPGESARYSLHPAWWDPDDEGIKTRVAIEFETDGSTRHAPESGPTTRTYQLSRTVTTIGKATSSDQEPDFRRIDEQAHLMVKDGDGTWSPHESGVDMVVGQLLPWELRDFFVMDADEATDFVGGSENKVVPRKEVEAKTTFAVHSLLGIDIFKEAARRVADLGNAFGAAATRAIGDANLDALQEELDQLRVDRGDLEATIRDHRANRDELIDHRGQEQDKLETALKGLGAADELRVRLATSQEARDRAARKRDETLSLLSSELESTELLASLCSTPVARAYAVLKPLFDAGQIPLKHLAFVRGLLETGTCVCGEDLSLAGAHRQHVEDRIEQSTEQEARADYLGQLHDAAKSLAAQAGQTQWEYGRDRYSADLATADTEISEATDEIRDIDAKLDKLDEELIQVIRDGLATIETQLEKTERDLALAEAELPTISSKVESLEKQILARQRSERAAADKRRAQATAELVSRVLNRAYATIQTEQVAELSDRMNRLFVQMAANVTDDDFDGTQRNKATLRMISEVGLRPTESDPERFEIYALNRRGRLMPPIEVNGASRRVLAISFVLALCVESGTLAPLVADSMLNFMSGRVRENVLKTVAATSTQPILLLTGSDLQAQTEADTVAKKAGATYTVTGQWHAIDAGSGGDVVNWTATKPVALLCSCGPRQYCSTCERLGQKATPGWKKRD